METIKPGKYIELAYEVYEVEKNCFEHHWSKDSFKKELNNDVARYLVAKIDDKVVGYVGIWFVMDEGHITNVAVHSDYRGKNHRCLKPDRPQAQQSR